MDAATSQERLLGAYKTNSLVSRPYAKSLKMLVGGEGLEPPTLSV